MNDNKNFSRGHILLVAIVLVTLLSITLAATMQPALTASQRMKERELIYRGEHLAAGIRRYYFRNGRFPFDLEELVDSEPRMVRHLYKDPMTEDGNWTFVFLAPEDLGQVKQMRGLARLLGVDNEQNSEKENDPSSPGLGRSVDSVFRIKDRQITGIRSQSEVEGLHIYQESRLYNDWLFSALPENQVNIEQLFNRSPPGAQPKDGGR